ncbi:hypothetical protein BGW37DRAFT_428380 [Umbelopsis sp. PMI_123]|nr:hypothetical protein BGW37DRAFT_428380 [Umbelopsis sp. PMI_123]
MCSKCFKESQAKLNKKGNHQIQNSTDREEPQSSSAAISSTSTPSSEVPPANNEKPVQLNKGRCFSCRVKIPLAKQTVNKCRCNYTFCDSHRYPDRHDCDFDYAKLGRDLLAKNNPKLNQRPKGGRTFQRIDSL